MDSESVVDSSFSDSKPRFSESPTIANSALFLDSETLVIPRAIVGNISICQLLRF